MCVSKQGQSTNLRFGCPEQMTAHLHHAALVRLLEQLRRGLGDASDEVLAVLFRKFSALVHGPRNQVDHPYLRFVVIAQVFVEDEGLAQKQHISANTTPQLGKFICPMHSTTDRPWS